MGKKVLAISIVLLLVCVLFAGCANTEELALIITTPVGNANEYTPASYSAYIEALTAAKEIENNKFIFQSEVDAVAQNLRNTIDGLTPPADKTELVAAQKAAKEINLGRYLPVSCEGLNAALENAKIIIDDANATDTDVKEGIRQIEKAKKALILRPDKTQLTEKYGIALNTDTTIYLAVSVKPFTEASNRAKTVIADDNATQSDVDSAISGLNTATAGLELKPDKTNLGALIEKANSAAEEKYTTASYSALQTVASSAKTVFNNEEATQREVDVATTVLQEKVDGLVKCTKCVWEITFSLRRTATNHVGNDWSAGVFYNGAQIRSGFEVTAREGSSISLKGKAVENDNIPDVGTGTLSLKLTDGNETGIEFYVRENRGRYSGYCATWELTASCKLIERV